jgi:hypothetical protein
MQTCCHSVLLPTKTALMHEIYSLLNVVETDSAYIWVASNDGIDSEEETWKYVKEGKKTEKSHENCHTNRSPGWGTNPITPAQTTEVLPTWLRIVRTSGASYEH